ncbi:Mitochondria fission 1 protein [Echinococcus granulosus]|uniref:Mitochondria fission 1 protein n=1 Tax=Echinococcus granulosus TaxID=6210 RepID=W6URH0_ECHGR|nr:Mitochondria fission 1 protein [Echinococcus granulosus]EUB63286.1 Mitochondria fission 1 protein [Echinococcus granulosus]
MELLDLNEPVTCARKSREAYVAEGKAGFSNYDTQISYALDLLKTKDENALMTAESLLKIADDAKKRECLFLIALANTKMGHYEKAIECCDNLLAVNPQDHQSSDLKAEIKRRRRPGTLGLGAVGLAVGGVALGLIGAAAAYGIQKGKGQ